MAYNSLKEFVTFLEEKNELIRIKEKISTRLEIAEICDRVSKSPQGGKALLFENVFNHNANALSRFPVLINALGSEKRMSWALGVNSIKEKADELEHLVKTQPPKTLIEKIRLLPTLAKVAGLTPKTVSHAACQEVVLKEDQVDLTQLPILQCWPGDASSFVTLPGVVTRDPETKLRNVGMYRMQLIDKKTTGMHWQSHKTGTRHYQQAKERGEKIPVSIYLGGDPALIFAPACPLPDGIDEMLYAGFLRGQSVPMVKCLTNDLEVPADADFVLEGYVDPCEDLFFEGPFGDHTGYYSMPDWFPKFHCTAITHKKNAIYPTTIVGIPPMEDAYMGKAIERLFLPLIKMVYPEIIDMNLPVEGVFHNLCLISIKKQYPAHAKKIMNSLWGTGQMMFTKCIIVVDDDVNVQNLPETIWRITANTDPGRDIVLMQGPTDDLDHAPNIARVATKMGIDATRKWKEEGYTREWPEIIRMDESTKKRVDELWGKLFE